MSIIASNTVTYLNTQDNWTSPKLFWFANVDYPATIPANHALMWDSATTKWMNKPINTSGTLGGLDGGNIGSAPAPDYTTITVAVDSFYNTY